VTHRLSPAERVASFRHGSAIHVMLQSQNHAQSLLLFNRLWNGIGTPA
jgi:hypothetical protein